MIGLVVGSSAKNTLGDYGIASNSWSELLLAQTTMENPTGGENPGGNEEGTRTGDNNTPQGCDITVYNRFASEAWELGREVVNKGFFDTSINYRGAVLSVGWGWSTTVVFDRPVCPSDVNNCCAKTHVDKAYKNIVKD